MFPVGDVSFTAHHVMVIASIGVILVTFTLWQLYYVRGRNEPDPVLSDGAVLMISDGVVRQASDSARSILGDCENQTVVRLLEGFLGHDCVDVRDAVNRLEITGDPVDLLVHDTTGHAYELIGRPWGSVIRLVIRDAQFLDDKLKDAAVRISAADDALKRVELEQETLSGLISEAPIIAWHRTAEGAVNWSGGEIKVRNSAILAEQAVELIVARTRLNRVPVLAGQPQKSRIEIVVNDGADTVSLHVLEIIRQDGSRIGFATDAGTAASAERTLTRFVQTMTETFAHLTVGLAIFDRNQTLALFNPALVQMWQVEPAWLARRPSLRDIIDELRSTRRLPELQDFHKWRARILELFENTEAADYEELWHLADGSNIRVLARPHPHGSLAFIFDDVTERVRLEQRYRHSIDLRRATLDRLNEGVAVFGANGLLQFVNQAFHEIWGTDGETVYAAMHARQLIALCEQLTIDAALWQRLHSFITEESRRSWTEELVMGSGRRLQVRIAPLPDGSTMAVFDDVANQSPQLALPQGPSGPQALLGTVQEGLDAAMTALSSGAATQDSTEAVAAARRALAEAMDAGPVRPQVGTAPPEYDLVEALTATVATLTARAEEAGVSLRAATDNAPRQARCDGTRIRQMLFNLTAEALRVAGSQGTVTLAADGSAEDYRIRIMMSGPNRDVEGLEQASAIAVAKRFAIRDGGEIAVEAAPDEDSARFICAFRPGLAGSQGAGAQGDIDDRIHILNRHLAG